MNKITRFSLGLFILATILLALTLGGIRLALVNIEYFKPEIEYLLSKNGARGVTFTRTKGSMLGFNPILRIDNISITLPDRSQPLFIDHLTLEFDFWASLRERAPVVLEMAGRLEKLELVRDEAGRWWADEFEIGAKSDQAFTRNFTETLALVPRYLNLDLRRLIIKNQSTSSVHQFDRVAARIIHRQGKFFMQLSAALPQELGRGLLIKSTIGAERSLIYVNASNLELQPIADLLEVDIPGLQDGSLDGQLWINLDGFNIDAIAGDVTLKKGLFQLAAERIPVAVDYHSRFNAINRNNSWQVANQVERLRIEGKDVPRFRSQFEISGELDHKIISAWVDRLEISSLPILAGQFLPPKFHEQIRQTQLQGKLEDLTLRLELDQPENIKLQSRVVGVNSQVIGDIPGIQNLNADIVMGNNRFGIKLNGKNVKLDFGDQFSAPIELDTVTLDAVAERNGSGLTLAVNEIRAANEDIKTWGRMWMKFDQDERPFMYLRGKFDEGQGSSVPKYLPIKLLPGKALAWLNRGIKDGQISRGDLQFHGRLRDLRELERDKSGEVYVTFDLEDGQVFFDPGWSEAKNGNGRVLFHNTSMWMELDQVSYDRLDNGRAQASIANLDKALLEIAIQAEMPADGALQIWSDTPVGTKYRKHIAELHDVKGKVKASIDVRLPIGVDGEEQVRVVVDFDNADAQARDWGLNLSQINGRIEVNNNLIKGRQIDALYFDDPIKIDIDPDKKSTDTLVKVQGRITTSKLFNYLPKKYTDAVSGKSDWKIGLRFSDDTNSTEQPYLKVKATTNLVNTQVLLPQPLAKPRQDSIPFSVDLDFFPQRMNLYSSFGSGVKTRGHYLIDHNQDFQFESFDVAFLTDPEENSGQGLHIYGHIPSISLPEWFKVISAAGSVGPGVLQSVDLSLDQVVVFDRILEKVSFELDQSSDGFVGRIDSSLVRGSYQVPHQPAVENPVILDLEYLRIEKLAQETDYSALRPSRLADFRLRSESLVYHDMLFNDVLVNARVVGETLHVDDFKMRRDEVHLTSTGIWEYDVSGDVHRSSLNAQLKGEKVGEAMAGLGFGDSMRGGRILLVGGLTWPAPLLGFDLENMVGDGKLRIEEGVLNNVKPGSGRLVGLLSLSALPRRLTLDFSDVIVKGMEFDKISGSYSIREGNLYTINTRMDGPAAKFKISGRTGILARDYEQELIVTPQVRGVLQLGALYSGNWPLLLLQTLFKKSIDKAVEIEYKITGSWDDPQIDLVKAVDENQQELPTIDK